MCEKILGEPDHEALLLKLNEMVADKELIHNEFRPIQNGYIGKGSFGAVFKGKRTFSYTNKCKM